jgi:hypothetical protein
MKSPILWPAILLLAGILCLVVFPHSKPLPGLLVAVGLLWLAYSYISSQRRKA